ncbi:MAG: VTT domain-containing protein [Bacilli bacterium]
MEQEKIKNVNKKRLAIVIIILIVFIALIVGLYFGFGLNKYFNDIEALREKIDSFGGFAKSIYVLINFLQTTLIPITNIPTIWAGEKLFGPFTAANLANIGVLLGSIVSFYLGRVLGRKSIEWIVGEDNLNKYLGMAKGRENLVIFLILLLPGFPDDIICMIAGITKMSWKFFLISILITRTIPTYLTAYTFTAIPMNTWWGILIWVSIYLIVFLAGRYVLKYWDNIVNWFDKLRNKQKEDHN